VTADEFEALPDDGYRYEVINGVTVLMSPSPSFEHQDAASEIEMQIRVYLKSHPVGRAAREIDVTFDRLHVYRPDLVFLSTERFPRRTSRLRVAPDMVLEVLSPGTKGRDLTTKRADYERFGVTEYWIVDTVNESMTFLRLGPRGYATVPVRGRKFASKAIPGFTLDIAAVIKVMRG
jgi:Uma2 family endonuclease